MSGAGFLSGALPLDGARALTLLEEVIDAGYSPVLSYVWVLVGDESEGRVGPRIPGRRARSEPGHVVTRG